MFIQPCDVCASRMRSAKATIRTIAHLVYVLAFLNASHACAVDPSKRDIDFNRDIRPILSDRCFTCHGPDHEDRQAGLRLDLREIATAALSSGSTAIVSGNPETSALLARVTSNDPETVMPPPHIGKPVTPREAAMISQWIKKGAQYRGHWAFEAVRRPAIPDVQNKAWPKNPVDSFVLARLEEEGILPSSQAQQETLARRVSLDLIGLPPTLADVDAFVNDRQEGAYERYVDRLLASEHFGERMAIEWLDAARYADSHGYQTDSSRSNWPWRDWVISAFNSDMPFDQFTIEQIAGDMLPSASRDQIVATGFNRNHRINGEGGIIAEEWRVETIIDRVETTGQTWLGLTVGCARCHDHKYDPLTQKEFYGLFSLFNNVPESGTNVGDSNRSGGNSDPLQIVASREQETEMVRLAEAIVSADKNVEAEFKNINDLVVAWEKDAQANLLDASKIWTVVEPLFVKSLGGAIVTRQADGSWLASGPTPVHETYEIVLPLPSGKFSAIKLSAIPDGSLPNQSLGRAPNGNFVLSKVEAEMHSSLAVKPISLILKRAEADYSQSGWDIQFVVDDNPGQGWAVDGNDPTKRLERTALFVLEQSVEVPENSTLTVRLIHKALGEHAIGRFRLAVSSSPTEKVTLNGGKVPDAIAAIFKVPNAERSKEQLDAIVKHYSENVDGPLKKFRIQRDEATKSRQNYIDHLPSAMVMKEGQPRQAFVLTRGQYDQPGEKIDPVLPAFLPKIPDGSLPNRLTLARWIVSRENPLAARVWVNRQWERLFGTGLVKTSENFGSQAEFPSHPELLDWLAAEFMDPTVIQSRTTIDGATAQSWSMKSFFRLIVTSATYRQSAVIDPEKRAIDPENRLLSRSPRIRLTGEIVRDSAIGISGLLVPKIGGPSVRPWMPEGVWDETSKYGDLRGYKADTGEGRYRRSMYTIWKRTAAPPTMLLFDAPNRETCTVKRSRTNTPLQALAILNEKTFIEVSHALALRMMTESGPSPAERLSHGFRVALHRSPSSDELSTLLKGFVTDLERFSADPEAAEKYLSFGTVQKPADLLLIELAAYSLSANVIVNLDEFVMRE